MALLVAAVEDFVASSAGPVFAFAFGVYFGAAAVVAVDSTCAAIEDYSSQDCLDWSTMDP